MNFVARDVVPSMPGARRVHADTAVSREHQLRAEIFMVHADQALRSAALQPGKILDGVAVRAELAALRVDRVRGEPLGAGHATRVEIRRAGDETVTPACDHVVAIAVGNHERVVVLRRDALE
jgi:hypothetical protein